jgi:hypothetical protein
MWGILASGLSACASMPPFDVPEDDTNRPTVANVLDKIECEIAEARDDPANNNSAFVDYLNHTLKLAAFKNWGAVATVSVTISDTAGLSPNAGLALSYLQPYKVSPQGLVFGGNALLYQQRSRIFTQTYSIDIYNISREQVCGAKWNTFNLEGDLGLRDQIALGLHTFRHGAAASYLTSATGDSFGATVSFDVFKGVTSLGPTWTLSNFKGVGGGLGYQRDDLDKIVITFAPAAYTPHLLGEKKADFEPRRAAALSNALESASEANSQLVETQAIQQLGQILSAH